MSPLLSWLSSFFITPSPPPDETPALTSQKPQKPKNPGRDFLDTVRKLHPPKGAAIGQVKLQDFAQLNDKLNDIQEQGLNVDYQDRQGQTAVMIAAYNGNLPLVKFLVEEKKADIHLTANDGSNALHSAIGGTHEVKEGQQDPHNQVAEYLLDRGIEFRNPVGFWQNTALGITAQRGNIPMLQKLLVKYVKEGGKSAKLEALAQTNKLGDMPLHNAAGNHQLDVARILIAEGAPVNGVNPENGNTPAHRAAIVRDKDMLILLYDQKAKMNIKNKNQEFPQDLVRDPAIARLGFMFPKLSFPRPSDVDRNQETDIFRLGDDDLQESVASSSAFKIPVSS